MFPSPYGYQYGYIQQQQQQSQPMLMYGGFGGFGVPQRSLNAQRPYDMGNVDYNQFVYNSTPCDLKYPGNTQTPQQIYQDLHRQAKVETDPVFRFCLRLESDNAYQSWKGKTDMGHYQQTMNTANGAEKALQKGW